MLRSKNYSGRIVKKVPISPLCESELKQVKVDVKDPLTGELVSERVEEVSFVRSYDEKSFCHDDSADLYSVENLSKLGIAPVVAPPDFIGHDLSDVTSAESSAKAFIDNNPDIVPPKND